MRQVVVWTDSDGLWMADCPSLPGCNAHGDSADEVIANIQQAIQWYVQQLEADGQPIPPDCPVYLYEIE
jgi:predicted RNase H-like HicB family nuclease